MKEPLGKEALGKRKIEVGCSIRLLPGDKHKEGIMNETPELPNVSAATLETFFQMFAGTIRLLASIQPESSFADEFFEVLRQSCHPAQDNPIRKGLDPSEMRRMIDYLESLYKDAGVTLPFLPKGTVQ